MFLDRIFGLSLSLSEITLLFDLSLYLDRTLAQRKAQWKAKSKVKVAQYLWSARRHQLSVPCGRHCMTGRHVFCHRTNSLEFTARWFVWSSCSLQTFSARLKNTPFHQILWSISILERFYVILLYKSTLTLHVHSLPPSTDWLQTVWPLCTPTVHIRWWVEYSMVPGRVSRRETHWSHSTSHAQNACWAVDSQDRQWQDRA